MVRYSKVLFIFGCVDCVYPVGRTQKFISEIIMSSNRKFTWEELVSLNQKHNAHVAVRGKVRKTSIRKIKLQILSILFLRSCLIIKAQRARVTFHAAGGIIFTPFKHLLADIQICFISSTFAFPFRIGNSRPWANS